MSLLKIKRGSNLLKTTESLPGKLLSAKNQSKVLKK
jgi:hypothetical protein